jgi:hypothetical protein
MGLPPEITEAAIECDIETLQTFLDQHPECVNDVDESDGPFGNRTMIDLTVCGLSQRPPARVLQALRLLLSRGADVNGRLGPEDPTGLHKSCLYAWREGVEALLQAGAEVNLTCRHGPPGANPSHTLALLLCDAWLEADPSGRMPVEVVRDMHMCVELLLRNGAPLDFLIMGEMRSLESRIQLMVFNGENAASVNDALDDVLDLAKAVRAAQSTSTSARLTPWQKYCLAPPKDLLRLRSLVARGRAKERKRLRAKTPRESSLLFAPAFPNELFWKVIAFWNPRY